MTGKKNKRNMNQYSHETWMNEIYSKLRYMQSKSNLRFELIYLGYDEDQNSFCRKIEFDSSHIQNLDKNALFQLFEELNIYIPSIFQDITNKQKTLPYIGQHIVSNVITKNGFWSKQENVNELRSLYILTPLCIAMMKEKISTYFMKSPEKRKQPIKLLIDDFSIQYNMMPVDFNVQVGVEKKEQINFIYEQLGKKYASESIKLLLNVIINIQLLSKYRCKKDSDAPFILQIGEKISKSVYSSGSSIERIHYLADIVKEVSPDFTFEIKYLLYQWLEIMELLLTKSCLESRLKSLLSNFFRQYHQLREELFENTAGDDTKMLLGIAILFDKDELEEPWVSGKFDKTMFWSHPHESKCFLKPKVSPKKTMKSRKEETFAATCPELAPESEELLLECNPCQVGVGIVEENSKFDCLKCRSQYCDGTFRSYELKRGRYWGKNQRETEKKKWIMKHRESN